MFEFGRKCTASSHPHSTFFFFLSWNFLLLNENLSSLTQFQFNLVYEVFLWRVSSTQRFMFVHFIFRVLFGSLLVLFYRKTAIIRSLPSKCSSKEDNFLFCWNKSMRKWKINKTHKQRSINQKSNLFIFGSTEAVIT